MALVYVVSSVSVEMFGKHYLADSNDVALTVLESGFQKITIRKLQYLLVLFH